MQIIPVSRSREQEISVDVAEMKADLGSEPPGVLLESQYPCY